MLQTLLDTTDRHGDAGVKEQGALMHGKNLIKENHDTTADVEGNVYSFYHNSKKPTNVTL